MTGAAHTSRMASSFRRCVRGFLVGGRDPRAVEVAEEGADDERDEDPNEDPGADEPVAEAEEETADEDTEDGSLCMRPILPPACA
jgi:hypothetical protein